ncbi:MAG: hypothetical protein II304_07480 [Bacteroidales bacterium]|nr:hypothetical protein [Bacteroidales bacterium]
MKKYVVYQAVGNFGHKVFESEYFSDVEDFLTTAWMEAVTAGDYEETESDEQLFYSYFSISEE